MSRPQREISRHGTLATWAEELGLEGPFGSSRRAPRLSSSRPATSATA
jgi:hypothetical protein